MVQNCCVKYCRNRKVKGTTLSFHSFPGRDPERRQKWIELISRNQPDEAQWTPTPYDKVCGAHFLPSDFGDHLFYKVLKDTAVPSWFPDYTPPPKQKHRIPPEKQVVPESLYTVGEPERKMVALDHTYHSLDTSMDDPEMKQEPTDADLEVDWACEDEDDVKTELKEEEDHTTQDLCTCNGHHTEMDLREMKQETHDEGLEVDWTYALQQQMKTELMDENMVLPGDLTNGMHQRLQFVANQSSSQNCPASGDGQVNINNCDLLYTLALSRKRRALPDYSYMLALLDANSFPQNAETPGLETYTINHFMERPYLCNLCGSSFATAYRLKYHQRNPSCEKPSEKSYKCLTCGAVFRWALSLKKHMIIHSGAQPYKCEKCASSFTSPDQFKTHRKTHFRSYTCQTCGPIFSWHGTLKCHRKIHSMLRPYKCETCGASFTGRQNLESHLSTHSG